MKLLLIWITAMLSMIARSQDFEKSKLPGSTQSRIERVYHIKSETSLDTLSKYLADSSTIHVIAFSTTLPPKEWFKLKINLEHDNGIPFGAVLNPEMKSEVRENDFLVLIINSGNKDSTILFGDSWTFFMQQEAKDQFGNWKNIEYRYSGMCGNSYKRKTLKRKTAYATFAKKHSGTFETEVRLKLMIAGSPSGSNLRYVFSEPFRMKIDPKKLESPYDFR